MWQLIADLKPNRSTHFSVLAMGERYDTLLNEFQRQAQGFNPNIPGRVVSGAGISFWLDKLVAALDVDCIKDWRAIDVAVCVNGTRPPKKYVTDIMRLLWSENIRSYVVESATGDADEAYDLAKLGALHIIHVEENGALRIRSWDRDRFQERHVTNAELVQFIRKLHTELGNANAIDYVSPLSNASPGVSGGGGNLGRGDFSLSTSASSSSIKSSYNPAQWSNVMVEFLTREKLTTNMRRRYENQVCASKKCEFLFNYIKKNCLIRLLSRCPQRFRKSRRRRVLWCWWWSCPESPLMP